MAAWRQGDGWTFGIDKDGGARFNLTRLAPLLEEVHERMAGVIIDCLGWTEIIDRWDRKGRLFYLDPSYWDGETDYGKGVFNQADFAALADRLRRLKGRFILSINTYRRSGRSSPGSSWRPSRSPTRSPAARARRPGS